MYNVYKHYNRDKLMWHKIGNLAPIVDRPLLLCFVKQFHGLVGVDNCIDRTRRMLMQQPLVNAGKMKVM